MIIAKFYGGLGNQLFQYAFARSLADGYGLPVKADITFYNTDINRSFILDKLGIEIEIASDREISDLHIHISKKVKFFRKKRYHLLREDEHSYFSFDRIHYKLERPKGLFVDGYWQHPNYLTADLNIIETCNSNLLVPRYHKTLSDLRTTESVAIHVRRGDYIDDKNTNEVHGTCSHQYYVKAIDWLNNRLDNPRYFIFSDDIAWCKANFIGEDYEYISNPDAGEWIDFALMLNCKHQVIANSTFSWWAAWFNENPARKIIAPQMWFKSGSWDTSELIPGDWLRF